MTAPALPVLAFGGLVLAGLLAGEAVHRYALAVTGLLAMLWIGYLRAVLDDARRRIAAMTIMADAAASDDLETDVAGLEDRLRSLGHRLADVHPVSGLAVRELLIARIEAARAGLLGLIAFPDLERLSAFDPDLADRVFATCTARLRAMVPEARFLAQLDRGHIGVWFGDAVAEDVAIAELDAISYALGQEVRDGETQIVPQVAHRLARYDATAMVAAKTFVTRALAAGGVFAEAAGPAIDPADEARERFALEQDLRHAIDRREFRLAYQPLVDAGAGVVMGAEALLRWDHPTRGVISPVQFVPIIEAMGMSTQVGTWVLNTAVREAHNWARAGQHNLRVAVNVSSSQLESEGFLPLVQRTLHGHGVRAGQLEIELTESVATSDAAHCRAIFEALRALGVRLAVDDFGTGYSGFSSLRALAFDKIKIDREFVTDVDTRADSQAICQSIIALGRGLGIRVLAEGVERAAEYRWLRTHGCRFFQGYLFGKPMEPAAFLAHARDRAWLDALLAPPAVHLSSLGKIAP